MLGVSHMRSLIRCLAVAAMLCLCEGCSDSGAPLHFILPNGFKGEVQIVEDRGSGLTGTKESGQFTYVVPIGGKLRVRSLRPFSEWHKESAAFQNGTRLQTGTDDNVPAEDIALRSLPT